MSKLSALRQELVDVMADVHRRGWCDGTGGNFSCLMSREPLQLVMAPSGVHKGNVSADELIVVDGNAAVIEGAGKASAETLLHLKVVRSCAAGAVLHSHSQAGTLLSQWALPRGHLKLQDLEMLKGLAGVSTHQSSVSVPVLANDQDLQRLSEAAQPHLAGAPHGLLIAGHGLYAWGEDLFSATRHLEILEFLLEQRWRQLLLQGLGVQP